MAAEPKHVRAVRMPGAIRTARTGIAIAHRLGTSRSCAALAVMRACQAAIATIIASGQGQFEWLTDVHREAMRVWLQVTPGSAETLSREFIEACRMPGQQAEREIRAVIFSWAQAQQAASEQHEQRMAADAARLALASRLSTGTGGDRGQKYIP